VAWDASAPSTLGIDWEVATESVLSLSSPSTCAAWFVDSTVTETISTLYVPHTWTGASTGYGKLAVDVYNIADAGAGSTLTETRYQPNEDDSAVNMFGTSPAWTSLSAGSCYTKVDETTADDSDYLNFTWTSKNRYAFNTAAMSAALQVSEVKWEIRAFGYWGTTGSIYVDLYSNVRLEAGDDYPARRFGRHTQELPDVHGRAGHDEPAHRVGVDGDRHHQHGHRVEPDGSVDVRCRERRGVVGVDGRHDRHR
jgi:hypothetical protein